MVLAERLASERPTMTTRYKTINLLQQVD